MRRRRPVRSKFCRGRAAEQAGVATGDRVGPRVHGDRPRGGAVVPGQGEGASACGRCARVRGARAPCRRCAERRVSVWGMHGGAGGRVAGAGEVAGGHRGVSSGAGQAGASGPRPWPRGDRARRARACVQRRGGEQVRESPAEDVGATARAGVWCGRAQVRAVRGAEAHNRVDH